MSELRGHEGPITTTMIDEHAIDVGAPGGSGPQEGVLFIYAFVQLYTNTQK